MLPTIKHRVEMQMMDEQENVYDPIDIQEGLGAQLSIKGSPTLTVFFPKVDQSGKELVMQHRWLHLVLLIDGSRYFFDFPMQRV